VLLAEVLVGSFYVETVIAVPGIGRYFITVTTHLHLLGRASVLKFLRVRHRAVMRR